MIPSDLRDVPSYPQTSRQISSDASQRLEHKTNPFKAVILQLSDPDLALILSYFIANKPQGYSIKEIASIHNCSLHAGFTAHLTHIEEEAKKLVSSWNAEILSQEQKQVMESWKAIVHSSSPIEVTIDGIHHASSTAYSFNQSFAACQAGEFSQIEAWVKEDRKRLQEKNELGENLLFAAVLGD